MEGGIPILDLRPELDELWPQINDAIQRVLRSTQFIGGPDVKQFEDEIAAYLGVKHAIGLNSGTDALIIALRAMGIGPGDEVITTTFTFFASAEAVSLLGATPVLCDVDPKTYNMDMASLESLITPKTKAIIPVHLFGHAAPMDEVMALAKRFKLKVIEDVAQAFSGKYKGKMLGAIGDVGAYSFFPSKNLGAYGDGGLLTTDDDHLAAMARMLRVHGSKKKYENEIVGYNSRLDTLQAAILRVKLPHIDRMSDGRRDVAKKYAELLKGISGLEVPVEAPYAHHVYHQYTVRIKGGRRDAVRDALKADGIDTMIYYPKPVHRLPVYASLKLTLPVAELLATEVLSLPIWPQMSHDVQERVAVSLRRAMSFA